MKLNIIYVLFLDKSSHIWPNSVLRKFPSIPPRVLEETRFSSHWVCRHSQIAHWWTADIFNFLSSIISFQPFLFSVISPTLPPSDLKFGISFSFLQFCDQCSSFLNPSWERLVWIFLTFDLKFHFPLSVF